MAIPPHSPKALVDSSNRTKAHSHLRPPPSACPQKSPPTRTISLASVTASPHAFPEPVAFIPFPNLDLPTEGACGGEQPQPEPWRRPRARTSHVETPRRAQPPPAPAATPKPKSRRPKAPTIKRAAHADLRFTALIERSISHALRERVRDECVEWEPESQREAESRELAEQDALLAARLRVALARQGWRRPPSASPTRCQWAPPVRPASTLLSGSTTTAPLPTLASSATPTAAPALTVTPPPPMRARSGSRGTTADALPLPALVAALLLRRHNERASASERTVAPETRPARRASPLAAPPV